MRLKTRKSGIDRGYRFISKHPELALACDWLSFSAASDAADGQAVASIPQRGNRFASADDGFAF